MKLSDFDYNLPSELIAQQPAKPRDHSRLLVLDKKKGSIEHKHFYDIVDYLQTGDVLVLNNSKVFPARLMGKKKETGGKMEVFLHKHLTPALSLPRRGNEGEVWQCLVGGRGAQVGLVIEFDKGLVCKIIENNDDGTWNVQFNKSGETMMKLVNQIGKVPLPPYIKRGDRSQKSDIVNYQTVYADKVGSVAAPTAGLHFTSALLKKIKAKGVQIEYVTLHVGMGTFAPVKVDDITKHKMHAEWVEVDKKTIKEIAQAKKTKRRVIAVGTTSARTLEAVIGKITNYELRITKDKNEWVDIFIYPGYKFKVVDGLITNFHLPKSSLLMLISAFAGKKKIDKAYQEAKKKKYRFYSYGDAMFIH